MTVIVITLAIIVTIMGLTQLTDIIKENLKERNEKKAWQEAEKRLAEDWKNSYLKK